MQIETIWHSFPIAGDEEADILEAAVRQLVTGCPRLEEIEIGIYPTARYISQCVFFFLYVYRYNGYKVKFYSMSFTGAITRSLEPAAAV